MARREIATNEAKAYTLAQRSAGGVLYVGTPTENLHAATKAYVDKLDTDLKAYIDEKLATNTTDGLRLIHTCSSGSEGFNAGNMTCSCDGDPITNGKFVIASIITSISLSKDGSIEEEYPHVPFTWIIPCSHLCSLEAGSEESISTTQTVHTVYPDGTKFVGLYNAYRETDNAYNFYFGVDFEDATEYDVSISGTFEIEVYG